MATGFILSSRALGSLSGLPYIPQSLSLGEWGQEQGEKSGGPPRHHPPAATAEQPQSSSSRAQLPMAGQRREWVG